MMDEAVGGLIVAAATGLAFIAYKHPKGYGRIYYALSWAFVVGGFSVFGWSLAIGAAARAAETAGSEAKYSGRDSLR